MPPAFSPELDRNATRSGRTVDIIAMVLLIIGGLNWGLIGLLGVDIVATLFGPMSSATRVVYVLVGVAAVYGFVVLSHIARPRI